MKVIHEYVQNSPSRDQEGWDQKYKSDYKKKYGTIDKFRYYLLEGDNSLCRINSILTKQIVKLRTEGLDVNMLDVGCGTGHQIAAISYLCDHCYAFDISREVIENNQQLHCNVDYMVGDALNHPKFEKPITLILMAGVLYAISDEIEVKKKILQEVYNSLDEKGIFVFYHRGYLSSFYKINYYITQFFTSEKERQRQSYRMSFYSDTFVVELLEKVGFKVLQIEKDDLAFVLTQGYLGKVFSKQYVQSNESYQKLNILGKFIYGVSKLFYEKLTARSSIFVAVKKTKSVDLVVDLRGDLKEFEGVTNILASYIGRDQQVYIYGTGGYTNKLLGYFQNYKVDGVLTPSAPSMQSKINSIPILHDQEVLREANGSVVFIASRSYEHEIAKRLYSTYKGKFTIVTLDSVLLQNNIDILN